MLGTCSKCNEKLPPGRNYCEAHYEQALAAFKQRVIEYERRMAEWDQLSDEEKREADQGVEASATTVYAGLLGALIGGAVWFSVAQAQKLDGLYGLLIVLACIAVCTVVRPIRIMLGRFMRAMIKGVIYFVVLAGLTFLVSQFSDLVAANPIVFYPGALAVAMVAAIVVELTGGHHETARPVRPAPPSP
jgi:hypothetical protein